jgi:prevent-host-death family protein
MRTIKTEDAQARFDEVLRDVENGETVIVTRNGRPVARISPMGEVSEDAAAAIEEIHRFRREIRPTLGAGITIRDLIEDGRGQRFSFQTEENPDEDDRCS